MCSNAPGAAARRSSGRTRPGACARAFPASASWPRSIGISNGPCSSKDSTTPTTSGCTIGCARVTPDRCGEHFHAGLDYQGKLARFMENHDEPRAAATSRQGCTRRRPSSPTCRPGCGSSTRDSSKAAGSAFRRTSSARRSNQSTATLQQFYDRLLAVLRASDRSRRRMAAARMRCRRGKETGRRTVSWRGSGRARLATAGWWPSTTRRTRASVTFACRCRIAAIGRCALKI